MKIRVTWFQPGTLSLGFAEACQCDWNGDGMLTVSDLLMFLDDWIGRIPPSEPGAGTDLNMDGDAGIGDLLVFVDCWLAATCP